MNVDQDRIRLMWNKEKDIYEKLTEEHYKSITGYLSGKGFSFKSSHRTKDIDSIIKKMINKKHTYDKIRDKSGIRIIVNLKEQLREIDNLIMNDFIDLIDQREDMSDKLGENIFGYQSIHYDLKLISDTEIRYCEFQLRTICQDNWSELSHALAYKSAIPIPKEIKRELNALSAVFELADNQFQSINNLIQALPEANPLRFQRHLETLFFQISAKPYDKEMTSLFLKNLEDLYQNESMVEEVNTFFEENLDELKKVILRYETQNIFFTQPEILVILERLKNKHSLKQYWESIYPIEDLVLIANSWGTSLN